MAPDDNYPVVELDPIKTVYTDGAISAEIIGGATRTIFFRYRRVEAGLVRVPILELIQPIMEQHTHLAAFARKPNALAN
jgi:hypothetical protein